MKDLLKLKQKSPLIILLGMALFITGLFWNSGQLPSWAAQGQPPMGTAPTRIPPDDDDDGGGDDDDDDDDGGGVSSAPGQVGDGNPLDGLPTGPGPGDGGAALADLSLKKIVDDPLPEPGQVITYSIVISNSGPSNAVDVLVLDQLPAGIVYSESVATRGSYSITTGLWEIELITVTEWLTLDLISIVTDTGRITNTTEITAASPADPDSIPANSIPIEDDWDDVVITSTIAIDDNAESNSSFIDQSQNMGATQPASNPEADATNLLVTPLEIPAETSPNESTLFEQVQRFPFSWLLLLAGGLLLIVSGLWLARR